MPSTVARHGCVPQALGVPGQGRRAGRGRPARCLPFVRGRSLEETRPARKGLTAFLAEARQPAVPQRLLPHPDESQMCYFSVSFPPGTGVYPAGPA